MKKLLFVGMVATVFAHQANAMVFKRNKDRKFVPVVHADDFMDGEKKSQENISEKVTPLIIVVKDGNDKPIMVRAKEYMPMSSSIKVPDTQEVRNILTATSKQMYDAGDGQGNDLYMQKTVLDKNAMKQWCDNFKKNSKKPGLWDKDYQEDRECIDTGVCQYLSNLAVKESFKHIKDEVNFVDSRIKGIQVLYKNECEYKENPRYAGLQLASRESMSLKGAQYFVIFDRSPYYKKGKQSLANQLENYVYHDALESLVATKQDMQNDVKNTSYFQWIWNNKKYKRTQDSLKGLNEEIAWFKQPENRNVFTKSCMNHELYASVAKSRE